MATAFRPSSSEDGRRSNAPLLPPPPRGSRLPSSTSSLTLARPRTSLALALALAFVATVLVANPAQAERSTRAEARLLSLMAGERQRAGVSGWSQADDLTTTAVRWSARMADEYGAGGGQRHNPNLASEVCCARGIAENVGWTSGGHADLDGAIDGLHAAFMDSQGHRTNVLSSTYTHVGVGVEVHSSGNVYVTVVFREPDGSAPTTAAPRPSPSPSPSPSAAPSPSSAPSPPSSPAPTGPDAPGSTDAATAQSGQAVAATRAPASETAAGSEVEDGAALGPPMRDPQELARLARQALAEQDHQLKQEVLQELERTLTSLTDGASRLIDALRWALGLDRSPNPPLSGS
jgi:uncharacterized protein YkwD